MSPVGRQSFTLSKALPIMSMIFAVIGSNKPLLQDRRLRVGGGGEPQL